MKARHNGFTLLEVLIALAVLAVALGAIFSAAGSYTANQVYLRDRTYAQWVARNQLARVQLSGSWPSIGREKGEVSLPEAGSDVVYSREWRWEMQVTQTSEQDLRRLDIDVFPREAGDDAEPVATLSGFVKNPA